MLLDALAVNALWFQFGIKHFICDFPLQADPWMYENKGTLGHPGGILHAITHGCGTAIVLSHFNIIGMLLIGLTLLDTFVHYFVDWSKVNLCRTMSWKADNSQMFWIALGFDQLLHFLTYYLIIKMII